MVPSLSAASHVPLSRAANPDLLWNETKKGEAESKAPHAPLHLHQRWTGENPEIDAIKPPSEVNLIRDAPLRPRQLICCWHVV